MTRPILACARCRVLREARPTTPLCRDCIAVLSRTELKAWGK